MRRQCSVRLRGWPFRPRSRPSPHPSDLPREGQNFNSLAPCAEHRGNDRDAAAAEVTLSAGARAGNLNTLEYSLPAASDVSIAVYDIAGRRVATLEQGAQSAGAHAVSWDAKGAARGMYFYRLQAGSVTVTRRVLIVK